MLPIRAVIVDDEPLAREALRELLLAEDAVELVGEYRNGSAFLADLPRAHPDVVFLDIEMPRLSGFDVASEIRTATPAAPFLVFVTAFDRYAVRAFEEQATDYLMKPFDSDRLGKTLARVRREMAPQSPAPLPLTPASSAEKWLTRIAIKAPGRIQLLRVDEIDWLEAAGNYVRVHAGKAAYLFRTTVAAIETRLDPGLFVRIQRGTIVHVDRIAELQSSFNREQIVLLRDGTRLTLSAPYRDRLRGMVEGL
ncbi:MAG: response regulator transcription factor [Acidobacteria bacterium]|nr:response regulator transcription factor [Acidobacteriota bacterium]